MKTYTPSSTRIRNIALSSILEYTDTSTLQRRLALLLSDEALCRLADGVPVSYDVITGADLIEAFQGWFARFYDKNEKVTNVDNRGTEFRVEYTYNGEDGNIVKSYRWMYPLSNDELRIYLENYGAIDTVYE